MPSYLTFHFQNIRFFFFSNNQVYRGNLKHPLTSAHKDTCMSCKGHLHVLQRTLPSRGWATRAQGQGIPGPPPSSYSWTRLCTEAFPEPSWAWAALAQPWASLLLSGAEMGPVCQALPSPSKEPPALLVPSPRELLIPPVPGDITANKPQSCIVRLLSSPLSYMYYNSSVCLAIKMKQIQTKETKSKVPGE